MLTPPYVPMVQMLFHKIYAQKQLMQIILSIRANINATPQTDIPWTNIYFPNWETTVEFGVYIFRVDAFIVNLLLLMAGKVTTEQVCTSSSRSLFSFLMMHLPLKIIETFSIKTAYTDKGIEIWEQVCKIQDTCMPKSVFSNPRLLLFLLQ